MPGNATIIVIVGISCVATLLLVWYFVFACRLRGKCKHPLLGFSVGIPDGWRGQYRLDYIDFKLPDVRWPSMEVELVGHTKDPSIQDTKELATGRLQQWRATFLSDRELTIADYLAYDTAYRHVETRRRTEMCRVSLIRDNIEYLIQIAARALSEYKDLFDKCVQSFEFAD